MFTGALPRDARGLGYYVRRLQSHFALRDDSALPAEAMNAVDIGIRRLIERAEMPYIGYIKSKADLKANDKRGMSEELRARRLAPDRLVGAKWLESHLRVFAEICENSLCTVNSAEAEAVSTALAPVAHIADRHTVRLAHRINECPVFPKEF